MHTPNPPRRQYGLDLSIFSILAGGGSAAAAAGAAAAHAKLSAGVVGLLGGGYVWEMQ